MYEKKALPSLNIWMVNILILFENKAPERKLILAFSDVCVCVFSENQQMRTQLHLTELELQMCA